jgi:hypothetical protein
VEREGVLMKPKSGSDLMGQIRGLIPSRRFTISICGLLLGISTLYLPWKETRLVLAARAGDDAGVSYYLESGADPYKTSLLLVRPVDAIRDSGNDAVVYVFHEWNSTHGEGR